MPQKFCLDLSSDILGVVTDGPTSMKKIGCLLSTTRQLCHQHGLHLTCRFGYELMY